MLSQKSNTLQVKSIGIDTYRENIIFIKSDCPICKSEGFTALTRIVVTFNKKSIVATLNVVESDLLSVTEAGLSIEAIKRLKVKEGDYISLSHLKHLTSLSSVRSKMYHHQLSDKEFKAIMNDIVAGRYSNIELAAFITACSGNNLSLTEIISFTKAMINSGLRINWHKPKVFDKHCIGGIPGNRTTPIVVSIIAAAGLTIPKTSSRAITSPAGTADTMETMTRVDFEIKQIKRIVSKENGCMVWGGEVKLSPADDILISVERALDIDSGGQMIASILSKKVAAGATHVVIDVPYGKTAKVRSKDEAIQLKYMFDAVAGEIGLRIKVLISDGSQPVGRGMGPSLEAMDVISVLKNERNCPKELKKRSVQLAGALLELSGEYSFEGGKKKAREILESGQAWDKFLSICKSQGGFVEPKFALYKYEVLSEKDGIVASIDNRKLARIAKLAGAPRSPSAGIYFLSPLGKKVAKNDVLFIVYAETTGQLEYALNYLRSRKNIIRIKANKSE